MEKIGDSPLPSYKRPPINEVVFGCQFEQLKDFKVTHFGELWNHLKKDFPKVEHALPIVNSDGDFPEDRITGLPLVRAWFVNNTDSRLVQFQLDRFYYNWRKKEGELAYPRFAEVFSCFERHFRTFNMFVADNNLGVLHPSVWELTYTNHIFLDESSSVVANFFKDLQWVEESNRFLPTPEDPVWAATFNMPNSAGTLMARLGNGKVQGDDRKLKVLELAARGNVTDHSELAMQDWFNLARDWIVRGFTDLTTKEAHDFWEREK
ncbi:TIGR04255 family protein [Pseudomonas chlororaphis]|uniref:TIGR04255 family protein n=1 Tax=Pseudomonas chlororaphis TaxID=587753 RepID=UPI001476523C|nr:TIGR04255 family protein [Pseudomonas chlororaphis]NNB44558.1 TIGR04255 family protein [Pseudomonas chlororaphis]